MTIILLSRERAPCPFTMQHRHRFTPAMHRRLECSSRSFHFKFSQRYDGTIFICAVLHKQHTLNMPPKQTPQVTKRKGHPREPQGNQTKVAQWKTIPMPQMAPKTRYLRKIGHDDEYDGRVSQESSSPGGNQQPRHSHSSPACTPTHHITM